MEAWACLVRHRTHPGWVFSPPRPSCSSKNSRAAGRGNKSSCKSSEQGEGRRSSKLGHGVAMIRCRSSELVHGVATVSMTRTRGAAAPLPGHEKATGVPPPPRPGTAAPRRHRQPAPAAPVPPSLTAELVHGAADIFTEFIFTGSGSDNVQPQRLPQLRHPAAGISRTAARSGAGRTPTTSMAQEEQADGFF